MRYLRWHDRDGRKVEIVHEIIGMFREQELVNMGLGQAEPDDERLSKQYRGIVKLAILEFILVDTEYSRRVWDKVLLYKDHRMSLGKLMYLAQRSADEGFSRYLVKYDFL